MRELFVINLWLELTPYLIKFHLVILGPSYKSSRFFGILILLSFTLNNLSSTEPSANL